MEEVGTQTLAPGTLRSVRCVLGVGARQRNPYVVPVKGHASGISFGRIVHYPELTGNEFHTQELGIRLIQVQREFTVKRHTLDHNPQGSRNTMATAN